MAHQENIFSSIKNIGNFKQARWTIWVLVFKSWFRCSNLKKIMKNWQCKLLKNADLLKYDCGQLKTFNLVTLSSKWENLFSKLQQSPHKKKVFSIAFIEALPGEGPISPFWILKCLVSVFIMLVTYCRLCRHCRNLAEGGCLLSWFHFTSCLYCLGHVTCWNLPWQGLFISPQYCNTGSEINVLMWAPTGEQV